MDLKLRVKEELKIIAKSIKDHIDSVRANDPQDYKLSKLLERQ